MDKIIEEIKKIYRIIRNIEEDIENIKDTTIYVPPAQSGGGGGGSYNFTGSLDESGGTVRLVNDNSVPNSSSYYGTDANGSKGYHALPSGAVDSVNGQTGTVVLDQNDIGLGNVDNTADLNKPISNLTQAALNNTNNRVTALEDEFNIFVNLIDVDTDIVKAPYNMTIESVTPETGTPTIKVNGSAYTLGDPINQFDKIEVKNVVDSLVILNCEK